MAQVSMAFLAFFAATASATCHDSEYWTKRNDPAKNCGWASGLPEARCLVKGEASVYAFEMCSTSCGSCGYACEDDESWHKSGDTTKDCAWVSRVTNRCTQQDASGVYAYERCRYACRTCEFDTGGPSSGSNATASTGGAPWTVSYKGAREACLDEVGLASHCPDAFPEFASSDETDPTCDLAIVGAGVGGLYTALRLVDEGVVTASEVCIFEATERVGGRTYSARYSDNDLVVDAGAYRTWPEFTPVLHAVITEYLGINMSCYDPSEVPCEKFIITDNSTGHNLGFTTYIEEMMARLVDAGARFFPWHHLKMISPNATDGSLALSFSSGATATVLAPDASRGTAGGTVVLNTPQRPLLDILRASASALSLDASVFVAAHAVQTNIATKLYLYYESTWWRQLGLTSGDFELRGDATNMLLKGRYHDGDVVCDDGPNGVDCRGFLLTVYVSGG